LGIGIAGDTVRAGDLRLVAMPRARKMPRVKLKLLLATAILGALGAASLVSRAEDAPLTGADGRQEIKPLSSGSFSFYNENDFYLGGSDQRYTNGFKISWLSPDLRSIDQTHLPGPMQFVAKQIGGIIDKQAQARVGLSLGQNIYTPTNIHTTVPQPHDRPYAAWLYLGMAFQDFLPEQWNADGTASVARMHHFEINIGMAGGPAALGEKVQNNWHHLIGIRPAQRWRNQIHSEPGLNLIYERKWRFSTPEAHSRWGADFIPHAGACLGNVTTYANVGGELRAGFRLPRDFGANIIRPSGDAYSWRWPFTFFVYAGIDGRAVLRDITLDGNSFRESPSIAKKNFVADLSGGFGVGLRHVQLTYTQVRRTKEFKGQSDPQDFGSIALTYYF
jgi:hypothetical protein